MKIRMATMFLAVCACGTAIADSGVRDTPPGFDDVITTDAGARTTNGNSLSDLATAAKSALAAADADATQRNIAAPDAAYARMLQKEFITSQPSNAPLLFFHETTDSKLLSNPNFDKHLRALFSEIAANPTQTANANTADARVLGGWQIPAAVDVVAITQRLSDGSTAVCSGSIITNPTMPDPLTPGSVLPTRILTAAHCVCEHIDASIRAGESINAPGMYTSYPVRQTYLIGQKPGQSAADRAAADYCPGSGADESSIEDAVAGRDLAVVEAALPIPLTRGYPRKVLSPEFFMRWAAAGKNKDFVRAVGYGFSALDDNGNPTGIGNRLAADIAIASYDCTDLPSNDLGCKAGELVAAGRPFDDVAEADDPDTCGGDSGGPIYAQVATAQGTSLYTIGVSSRGTDKNNPGSCGAGSIYTVASTAQASGWLRDMGATIVDVAP